MKSDIKSRIDSPLIVGIGAAANEIGVLEVLFSMLPIDSGMSFILLPHMLSDSLSRLKEIIAKSTQMSVIEARDGIEVDKNTVYIIPPNTVMALEKGNTLISKTDDLTQAPCRPIDTFFSSLAEELGENAIGVLLLDTKNDGLLGVTKIKEKNGITFAPGEPNKSTTDAILETMAATTAGYVDYVMPVEAIPAKLLEYQQYLKKVQSKTDGDGAPAETEEYLPEIFFLLRSRLGHDFSHYKEKTMIRRIQRRMQILQIESVSPFIEALKKDQKELELLFQDLLIGVTEFFRDPEAFYGLEMNVIPKIFEKNGPDNDIRVWVAGCSTGEEAYSIAILLAEAVQKLSKVPNIIIFATDINEQALLFARNGRYMKSQLAGVSSERLNRWFVKEGEHYCVSSQIRDMCIFSVHSLIKDPPFSKLDLISCRNLLIYLDAALQERLIPIFHYALQSERFLFLGSSEGIGRGMNFFTSIDEKCRLFQRVDEVASRLPSFPLLAASFHKSKIGGIMSGLKESGFERGARRVMERYSPAHIIIDRQHQVLSFSGKTGKYLDPSPGAASLDLFQLLQKSLCLTLRNLTQQAFSTQQRVTKENILFEVYGKTELVTLIVEPIIEAAGNSSHYVVIFQEIDNFQANQTPVTLEESCSDIAQLQSELHATRARLQAALDQADEANEDLKAYNDELQSLNEELHSANEELETSKEEMQAINEELQTVNTELTEKNNSLIQLNRDLQNFFQSTHIATLFLDKELCIRKFTPAITEIFHLREGDIGRPITEIVSRLNYDELKSDVIKTLQKLEIIEREITLSNSDMTFMLKIQPYKTEDHLIEGVVMTFVDISERKRAEIALKESEEQFRLMVQGIKDYAIYLTDRKGKIIQWNEGAERLFGYKAEEILNQTLAMFFLSEDVKNNMPDQELKIAALEDRYEGEGWRIRKGGERFWANVIVSALRNDQNELLGFTKVIRDMTKEREATQALINAKNEAEVANQKKDEFLSLMSHELRTPLNSIIGFSRMLETSRAGALTEKQAKYTHNIHSSGQHLLRIINDLLDLSKVEAGKMKIHYERVELAHLLEEINSMMGDFAKEKNVQMSFEVAPDLKAIEVDPDRFKQILINLISNAIKFNREEGTVFLRLFKMFEEEGQQDWLVGEVRDTGIGIPSEKLPELFKKFQQLDTSAARQHEGTGLGLVLSKELIELHSGEITVESKIGVGTTFTFRLPLFPTHRE